MASMLFNVMRIIGSGLQAQRKKMEAIASNIANAQTTRAEDGLPYRRKDVVIKEAKAAREVRRRGFTHTLKLATTSPRHISRTGIELTRTEKIEEPSIEAQIVEAPPDRVKIVYDPHHPDADENGYVAYPDINPIEEMVDMMTATRAYEANVAAMEAFRSMVEKALEI